MYYLLFKSLHLVSMVAWFAGLFYLVRLFVYHRESFEKPEPGKSILISQYHIMEKRLFSIICNPAMILTWLFGLAMIAMNGLSWLAENSWLHVKLLLLVLLSVYHFSLGSIIKLLEQEKQVMSPFQFRLFNELPSLFLLSIVLLAIYKNLLNFGYTFGALIVFAIILFLFAKIYKLKRQKSSKSTNDLS